MDLTKQYILQCISSASNSLRLTTQKIEVVALLRETIINSDNIERDIKQMKKITEFSTFAIRLNEILNYLTGNNLDLLRLSDKFKEHSQFLIKDLSSMLDMVNPATFNNALEKMNKSRNDNEKSQPDEHRDINVNLSNRRTHLKTFEEPDGKYTYKTEHTFKSETDIEKEKLIFEDEKEEDDAFFQNYESEILKPIKPIDKMLKKLSDGEQGNPDELNNFSKLMMTNGELSAKIGFDIISSMHQVIAKALQLIKVRELMPGKDVIESMRACLIVIVAVVKGKEVDITSYLNRAEEFGREIQSIKIKGLV